MSKSLNKTPTRLYSDTKDKIFMYPIIVDKDTLYYLLGTFLVS